ncbi:MAG: type IX secretion system membrane protein PorP/SprF [Flavobacteriaceae bacterium]|jgi:type IX secretion system PorP/SprF family membrane protein|nr:type IX secretion system membrane protein PorP/SprF [Flavobacteriaceae bacterium]MDG1308918.1 type IX secretion system membrane protein PorP/SprF [Flavobacteriaceae bacterium]|tara:strand:- start:7967 stop:8884 length:918 start_codon:yes stop_codon:yes gene_type:complete
MKNLVIILFTILCAFQVNAQQDPQYTQYMYNMNIINPAYTGSTEGLAVGALYRSQWVGLDGGPETFTFNIHSPVGKNVGLGMSIISDQIGPVKETNAYVDFSYTIPVGTVTKLAFGVKGGFTFHDIGIAESQITLVDQGDPFFANAINETTPNVGAGVYFYKPSKYYISLSIPNILNGVHLDANGTKIGSESEHFFAAAGYVFDLSENFKLKPHTLIKYAFDAPMSYDINANVFMFDLVEVGVGYRLEDSFSGMINFQVANNLRIGYAYDAIQSDLNIVTSSSHEIFINFDLNFSTKVSRSPRYF